MDRRTIWPGSGGGKSAIWPIPNFQGGIAGAASTQFRNVPDVALNADPASGYAVVAGIGNIHGGLFKVGGTSAAAPLWAGLTALINQQRAVAGVGNLGFANSPLYELGTSTSSAIVYSDITTGNNGFYTAGAGYDNTTGLGSFRGVGIVSAAGAIQALLFDDLSNVYAFPNPWDARRNHSRQITFTNGNLQLADDATVKIFTLSGFWVKTISSSHGAAAWDLTNDAGERVASGLYFYLVSSGNHQAKGTVAIIK